ncbi:14 kDa phosphohistidine phosphatase-like [Brevipalpus obovatus]|uniref:14 kDa phosphohistidine phosphatase-like n=1 Tax=Brevipalpus obovatus TaxID=246614 RepID=UPI003D9F54E5
MTLLKHVKLLVFTFAGVLLFWCSGYFDNFSKFNQSNPYSPMDAIKEVVIDEQGKFKYIQINVKNKKTGEQKLIVRGTKVGYHSEILDATQSQLGNDYDCESPGGGRIIHEPEKKKIFVFGYSMSFGLPSHEKTCELIRKYYPEYTVEWSNDGY